MEIYADMGLMSKTFPNMMDYDESDVPGCGLDGSTGSGGLSSDGENTKSVRSSRAK